VFVDDLVERETVLESRAAAAGDEHAELQFGIALLVDPRRDLSTARVGEHQRARHFVHCIHSVLRFSNPHIIGHGRPRVKNGQPGGKTPASSLDGVAPTKFTYGITGGAVSPVVSGNPN